MAYRRRMRRSYHGRRARRGYRRRRGGIRVGFRM